MRQPRVTRSILDELQAVFPGAKESTSLDFDSVQAHMLPFTLAVFNEALRLYPPVPIELKDVAAERRYSHVGSVVSRSIEADLGRGRRWLRARAMAE